MQRALSLRGAERRGNLPEGQPYTSDPTMFLPVGKSDAPMSRCAPLARCGLCLSLRALIRGHFIAVAVIFVRYLLIDINKKRTRGFGYVFYVLSLLFENRLQGDYGVAVAAVRSKSQILFGKGDIFVHAETVEVAHADVVLRDRQVLLCRLHII